MFSILLGTIWYSFWYVFGPYWFWKCWTQILAIWEGKQRIKTEFLLPVIVFEEMRMFKEAEICTVRIKHDLNICGRRCKVTEGNVKNINNKYICLTLFISCDVLYKLVYGQWLAYIFFPPCVFPAKYNHLQSTWEFGGASKGLYKSLITTQMQVAPQSCLTRIKDHWTHTMHLGKKDVIIVII